MSRLAVRLEVLDPGFVRTRQGVRATSATVLSGLTLFGLTSALQAAEALRISLFGAGGCFLAALLVADRRRGERARTFGLASVVSAVAIVVTVELTHAAAWAAAAFLVSQMFMSYALRRWSLRAGNLAVIGALMTFLVAAMQISTDQVGWLVVASTGGLAWIALSEYIILPDDPVRTVGRCVDVFRRSAADAVACVAAVLIAPSDGETPHRAERALRRSLGRVRRCRAALETQLSVPLPAGFGPHDVERLRVALYCAERGLEEMVRHAMDPRWVATLPDDVAGSITGTLSALARAASGDADTRSLDAVAGECARLRDHIGDATAIEAATALAALTTVGSAHLIAESISQATSLATIPPVLTDAEQASVAAPPTARVLAPTMALGVQAAVACVLAGLIAKWVGSDQSLLVAWTAYVIIAGSAEATTRRA